MRKFNSVAPDRRKIQEMNFYTCLRESEKLEYILRCCLQNDLVMALLDKIDTNLDESGKKECQFKKCFITWPLGMLAGHFLD